MKTKRIDFYKKSLVEYMPIDLDAPGDMARVLPVETRKYLDNLRLDYSEKDVINFIAKAQNLKVLVIGDTIIDEYVSCEPMGQSLKNPIIVHKYNNEERFCGGAVAVANQIAQFCDNVTLTTVIGGLNDYETFISDSLASNVELQCFRRPEIPTVVKRRFVYEDVGHKVFEVCNIDDSHPPVIVEQAILKWIREQLEAFDLVIVSDYGHGVITADIASALQSQAVFISVNAQTNSANVGYNLITKKYSCVNLACIDESEARLAGQDKHKDIEVIGNLLLQRLAANCLIITRGRKGSVAFEKNGSVIHCPSFAIRVVDRVGAGDDFFTIASLGAKLGISTKLINFISNAMGALSVQVVGNRESINAETFKEFVKALLD